MNILYYCHILYERTKVPILNILLKIQLILNGINGNIKTMYTLPILRIHPTAKVTLGNGVQFNNKDNVGWYSRCRIQALRNSRLTIGENTGISSSLIFCDNTFPSIMLAISYFLCIFSQNSTVFLYSHLRRSNYSA